MGRKNLLIESFLFFLFILVLITISTRPSFAQTTCYDWKEVNQNRTCDTYTPTGWNYNPDPAVRNCEVSSNPLFPGIPLTTCCQRITEDPNPFNQVYGYTSSCQQDQKTGFFGYNKLRCCFAPPAPPTPTPTPTPEPCITYGTTGNLSYPNTCAGTNGTYTDKCNGNQTITYSCNSSGACQSFTSACNADEACVEEPANGLTHCVAVPTPAPGVVAQQEQCNSSGTAWVAVTNVCVVSSSCSVPPVSTPIPTPTPCQVTTFPSSHNNLIVGGAGGLIQAQVSSGQGTAIIKQMRFGSYNTTIATANPTSDSTSVYSTTAACGAVGNTAVWATADLSDGRSCQSTGTTDTDITCVTPTPTPTPTLTPVPKTVTIQGRNVDTNGAALTANIGQSISISGPTTGAKTSLGAWDFTGIPAGTYTVTAAIPAGYTVSYSYSGKKISPPTAAYISGNNLLVTLPNGGDWADIYFKYIPTPCLVTTSPAGYNLNVGGTGGITATVTGVPTGKTVSQMLFGSYNTAVANVSPSVDPSSPYSTTATAVAVGNTAVWATAKLNDGDTTTCQTPGDKDTDINVYPAQSGNGGGGIGSPCSNNFQCLLNYCDPVTKTCQNPPAGPGGGGTPTPLPSIYSISGKMFNDANENGKSGGDSNYTGAVTISLSPASGIYTSPAGTGNYSFANLPAGQYTLTFSGLPAGSRFTYPNTPGNSLIVNVGAGCSVPVTSEALCSLGNITNLNAGVTNTVAPWIQSVGADMKLDSGFNNPLPSNNTYSSILGTGGMPGIIFSGCSTPIFGLGQASQSQFNWQVGGTGDKCDLFTDTHNSIPSSYRFFLETAQSSGIMPTDIAGQCGAGGISNCTLNSSLARGLYLSNGNLTLSNVTYTFPLGNFIILINGNLTINGKIKVPIGSTAIFSAKEDIIINGNLGETASSTASTIEGVYSADSDFIAEDLQNCSIGADLRLNVAGSVIANAGRFGGTFVNNRSLCVSNAQYPTVSFIERPDFMLSYPSITTQNTRSWKNEAP